MKQHINFDNLVAKAIQAPSGHNTQPWKFTVKGNAIHIHPDLKRALPIVDPDNHALYISLGCAAENCILAAKAQGLSPLFNIKEHGNGPGYITITLEADNTIQKDDLYDFIEERQVVKMAYKNTVVSKDVLRKLIEVAKFEGIEMKLLTDDEELEMLKDFIVEGSNLQFQNKDFVEELIHWIRFSKGEASSKGDGVWNATMGMPGMGRFLGERIMRNFATPKSEAKRWEKLVRASAGFFLFTVDKNDIKHWITLGRAFQRFGLKAAELGISHAHVNMPCEEISVRQKMMEAFGLDNRHPLLLIRVGYADKMPYSFRRPVSSVFEG